MLHECTRTHIDVLALTPLISTNKQAALTRQLSRAALERLDVSHVPLLAVSLIRSKHSVSGVLGA